MDLLQRKLVALSHLASQNLSALFFELVHLVPFPTSTSMTAANPTIYYYLHLETNGRAYYKEG
jgi:hypothetical protein